MPADPISRARYLRKQSTDTERLLWKALRNRKLRGLKFRRQEPVGEYTLDFFCPEAGLALELDGGGHAEPHRQAADFRRDAYLCEQGIEVMRIWNSRFSENPEGVLFSIAEKAEQMIRERRMSRAEGKPSIRPSPQPSPAGREREKRELPLPTADRRVGEGWGEGRHANSPPIARQPHLTYCLNIHPGDSWDEQFAAIQTYATAVRDRVWPTRAFGLGLRLSDASAHTLSNRARLDAFREYLNAKDLYAFTINAFPFGAFHGARVKENVYRPDWRSDARLAFTLRCADILATLNPPDGVGSISTVPVGYAPDFIARADTHRAMDTLITLARALAEREAMNGVCVRIGLEPEPGCVLETCSQTISFFDELHSRAGADAAAVERHIGVCLDTCHVALAFESPAETWAAFDRAGIRVEKIQISAALEFQGDPPASLAAFSEPVYLHQVRCRLSDSTLRKWNDLPEALAEWPRHASTTRVHFHVPLFWPGGNGLYPTTSTLDSSFWARIRSGDCPHLEIETYTFDVLPAELRDGTVVDSIEREFEWVKRQIDRT